MNDPIFREICERLQPSNVGALVAKGKYRFKMLRGFTGIRIDIVLFESMVERLDLQISHAESLTALILVELPAENILIPKDWKAIKIKSISRDFVLLTSDMQWIKWAHQFLTESI